MAAEARDVEEARLLRVEADRGEAVRGERALAHPAVRDAEVAAGGGEEARLLLRDASREGV